MKFVKGDIVFVDLNPIKGHEQRNKRPVLVINKYPLPGNVNLIMPITSKEKDLPFQVDLDERTKTSGVVLTFQIKVLDLNERQAKFLEKAPKDIVDRCCELMCALIS